MDFHLEDSDSLNGLEERILRAVELVTTLKDENAALKKRLHAIESGAEEAAQNQKRYEGELAEAKATAAKAAGELDSLRAERKQVKTRIEKLLGQMDLLSAN